jgi:hypothetical protein
MKLQCLTHWIISDGARENARENQAEQKNYEKKSHDKERLAPATETKGPGRITGLRSAHGFELQALRYKGDTCINFNKYRAGI